MYLRTLIFAMIAVFSPLVWAADAPEIPVETVGSTVYIADAGATELRQTLALRVAVQPEIVLPSEITFHCTVLSPAAYDAVELTLTIEPTDGPVVYEGAMTVDIPSGEREFQMIWPAPGDFADGDYRIQVTAARSNGTHLASTRLSLRSLSPGRVSETVSQASAAIGGLDAHVSRLGREAFAPAVLHRLAIAHETVRFAEDAWQDSDWPLAYDRALEALDADASVRSGLTFAALAPERFATSPSVSPAHIAIRNAAVESSSSPVFLYGVRLTLPEAEYLADIARFGMNAVVLELSPADVLPDSNSVTDLHGLLKPILDECDSLGIAVALQLQPQKMTGWALDQWPDMARAQFDPFYYDVTHPRALHVLAKFYAAVGAYLDREPRIFAVSVVDAPRFRISDEPMRQGLVVHLRQHYESDVALNLAWQTRLPSIDDIPIRWDWEKRSYQAHLQRYHRDQVTGFFSWIVNALGPNARRVPLAFTAPGSTFAIGSFKDGIDSELLNGTFAASGCESITAAPPSAYALPFPDTQMQVELSRSMNRANPVINFGAQVGDAANGLSEHADYPYRERARIWQAAMDGVDVNFVPLKALFDTGEGRITPHDTRDLAGFVSGGHTLNRLAGVVQQFQTQVSPVAILWSDSSRMLDNGAPYLPSLRRAYEGAACFGLPLRFISERQMAAGELSSVSILILPEVSALTDAAFEALEKFVENGGRLVSTGSSVPYDAYAESRALRLQASPLTKLVRGVENADNYLRALDAAFEASDLKDFPRAVDELGYPIPGIVSRYLENDEGRYLYLVNLNHDAKRVQLPVGRLEGRDVIDGRVVQFPLEIEPLDPMLIAITPAEAEVEGAASGLPEASGPPSAMVEPVALEQ